VGDKRVIYRGFIAHESPSSSGKGVFGWDVVFVFFAVVLISVDSARLRDRLDRPPFAEEARIAGHLIHGDGFLSPYDALPNAPASCYSPPVYPGIITVAYWLGGMAHAVRILLAVNSISFGVIGAGVYWLGKFYVSTLAGGLAAALLAFHPVMLYFVTDWWDSFVALAMFVGLLVAAARQPSWRKLIRASALIGVEMGILSLTNPSYVLSYPLLVLVGLRGRPGREKMLGIFAALGSFALVLTPWTIRNLATFDRFYFVRDGAGFQMWLGIQPKANGWLDGEMLRVSPAVDEKERALILEMGEPAYFDLCTERMKEEYNVAPQNFWIRSAKRFCFVFVSDPTRAFLPFPMMRNILWRNIYWDRAALSVGATLLGLAGLLTVWRLGLGCAWIFFAGFLAEIPFFFTAVSDRYNLPMRVMLILFAGIFLGCVIERLWNGKWPESKII
jgi:hypothetical protein